MQYPKTQCAFSNFSVSRYVCGLVIWIAISVATASAIENDDANFAKVLVEMMSSKRIDFLLSCDPGQREVEEGIRRNLPQSLWESSINKSRSEVAARLFIPQQLGFMEVHAKKFYIGLLLLSYEPKWELLEIRRQPFWNPRSADNVLASVAFVQLKFAEPAKSPVWNLGKGDVLLREAILKITFDPKSRMIFGCEVLQETSSAWDTGPVLVFAAWVWDIHATGTTGWVVGFLGGTAPYRVTVEKGSSRGDLSVEAKDVQAYLHVESDAVPSLVSGSVLRVKVVDSKGKSDSVGIQVSALRTQSRWVRRAISEGYQGYAVTPRWSTPDQPESSFFVDAPKQEEKAAQSTQPVSSAGRGLVSLAEVCPSSTLGEFRHGTKCTGFYADQDDNGKNPPVDIQVTGTPTLKKYTTTKSLVHAGVDLVAEEGTAVFPIADGTVDDVIGSPNDINFQSLGYMVIVEHSAQINGKPTFGLYLHLKEKPAVMPGQVVVAGKTRLGSVGATGAAFGPHLHLEVRHFPERLFGGWGNIYGVERPRNVAKFNEKDFTENWEDPASVQSVNSSPTGTANATADAISGNGQGQSSRNQFIAQHPLKDLLGATRKVPAQPDKEYSFKGGKNTLRYPAEFTVEKSSDTGIEAFIRPSPDPESGAFRDVIAVLYQWNGLFGSSTPLNALRENTAEDFVQNLSGAVLSETVNTTMGGLPAQMFMVVGEKDGRVLVKVVVLAVSKNHFFGAVLHATPATLMQRWDAYKCVIDSYVER